MDQLTADLPSGAKLRMNLAPFADGLALFQAVNEEALRLQINGGDDMDYDFFKNIACIALSSKKIAGPLAACMSRCLYNDEKITNDTWEPAGAREDYVPVCAEVLQVNLHPFVKNLPSLLSQMLVAAKALSPK